MKLENLFEVFDDLSDLEGPDFIDDDTYSRIANTLKKIDPTAKPSSLGQHEKDPNLINVLADGKNLQTGSFVYNKKTGELKPPSHPPKHPDDGPYGRIS